MVTVSFGMEVPDFVCYLLMLSSGRVKRGVGMCLVYGSERYYLWGICEGLGTELRC